MGRLCRETLPSGQTWECRYDDGGNLLEKKADTGEEFRYAYDEYGFLIEEAEKIVRPSPSMYTVFSRFFWSYVRMLLVPSR